MGGQCFRYGVLMDLMVVVVLVGLVDVMVRQQFVDSKCYGTKWQSRNQDEEGQERMWVDVFWLLGSLHAGSICNLESK